MSVQKLRLQTNFARAKIDVWMSELSAIFSLFILIDFSSIFWLSTMWQWQHSINEFKCKCNKLIYEHYENDWIETNQRINECWFDNNKYTACSFVDYNL